METRKLSRRDFLKISAVGSVATALVACGGVVGEKIVNVVTSTPAKDKKLGIQTDKVQILDKEGLAKDNPFQAQRVSVAENQFGIAVAEALKAKGISDVKIVTEQFTITFPVLGLDGKETNPVYSFVSAINITSAVSYVGRVSIGADGRGSVQSLVPQDISVEGRTRGALTLNGQPVFVYPLSSKEWIALSDAEKLQASVDFYPGGPTGEKLPLPSNKISGLARIVAQTPTPEAATSTPTPTTASTEKPTTQPTNTPAPTEKPTQAPTQQPRATEKPQPTATSKPENKPIVEADGVVRPDFIPRNCDYLGNSYWGCSSSVDPRIGKEDDLRFKLNPDYVYEKKYKADAENPPGIYYRYNFTATKLDKIVIWDVK